MSNRWSIEANRPKTEKQEWHTPNDDQEHVEETTAPGDLNIKPSQISLKPTLRPTRSGVQSGQIDWNYESRPDPSWYIWGGIVQEDD